MTEGQSNNELVGARSEGLALAWTDLIRALRLSERGLMMRLMSDMLSRLRP
jgi:hypothetical protein